MTYTNKYLGEYVKLLKSHDWSYDYSDDHSKWTRGFEQRSQLEAYARDIDPKYKIWNQFAPSGFERVYTNGVN